MNTKIPGTAVQTRDTFEDSMDILAFVVDLDIVGILPDGWDSMLDGLVAFAVAGTVVYGVVED